MAHKRQLKAGATVTYHGEDGDREARIARFDGLGRAGLIVEEGGDEMIPVAEGRDVGTWTAIPPRRMVER